MWKLAGVCFVTFWIVDKVAGGEVDRCRQRWTFSVRIIARMQGVWSNP